MKKLAPGPPQDWLQERRGGELRGNKERRGGRGTPDSRALRGCLGIFGVGYGLQIELRGLNLRGVEAWWQAPGYAKVLNDQGKTPAWRSLNRSFNFMAGETEAGGREWLASGPESGRMTTPPLPGLWSVLSTPLRSRVHKSNTKPLPHRLRGNQ